MEPVLFMALVIYMYVRICRMGHHGTNICKLADFFIYKGLCLLEQFQLGHYFLTGLAWVARTQVT